MTRLPIELFWTAKKVTNYLTWSMFALINSLRSCAVKRRFYMRKRRSKMNYSHIKKIFTVIPKTKLLVVISRIKLLTVISRWVGTSSL